MSCVMTVSYWTSNTDCSGAADLADQAVSGTYACTPTDPVTKYVKYDSCTTTEVKWSDYAADDTTCTGAVTRSLTYTTDG